MAMGVGRRGHGGARRRGRRLGDDAGVGLRGAFRTHAAADEDACQERHDQDDRDRHEQEDQLLAAQLNFPEAVVLRCKCQSDLILARA